MKEFDLLVGSQLQTMEKLLSLQSEIERCQQVKEQLNNLPSEAKCQDVQAEIDYMKRQLRTMQKVFEKQTEEVIRVYQKHEPMHK